MPRQEGSALLKEAGVAPAADLDQLLVVLEAGRDHIEEGDEGFSLLEHELQCAAVLAEWRPQDEQLQAAGLVHDIGHTLLPGRPECHAALAGAFLGDLLGERTAELVRLHVEAKRYLVTSDPAYRSVLNPASVSTLQSQGEALQPEEVAAFAAHPLSADAVMLRRADDAGKVAGALVSGLESWRPLLARLADSARSA